MPFDKMAEGRFIALAHAGHEGEVVGFGLGRFGHEAPLLNQRRKKKRIL